MLKTFKSNALKSKNLQTSQISLSIAKKLTSHALVSNIHPNINIISIKPNVPLDTNAPKLYTPTPQDPLCNLKAIKSPSILLAWWAHILLDINRTREKIAQTYTHTQRHMNNIWNEMVLCFPCFAFYCFSYFHWFIQTLWDNSYSSSDWHCSLILTLLVLMPLPLHFY